MSIRVAVFDDNAKRREGLQMLIDSTDNMTCVGAWPDCRDVVRHVMETKPDVVLMDIDMPVENGLQGLRAIRAAGSGVMVLMFTVMEDNENVFQAICHGASGYLLKQAAPEKILEAIREAITGGAPMTPSIAKKVLTLFTQPFKKSEDLQSLTAREHDVLSLLVRGHSYKMAAAQLEIGVETLRFHIKNIYTKLHVNSKSEAVAKALQNRVG
jgi:two-component system, NarL family, nitrate/nitrite response regulator NarL